VKETFREYYRPNEDEFSQLWENCLFVFDTNVLLNIYRYTSKTRQDLIETLCKLSDRLWVPYQVALEYQQKRLDVISEQELAYTHIQNLFNDTRDKLKNKLISYKIHPFIKVKIFNDKINNLFLDFEEELNHLKQEHPNLIERDEFRDIITNLFSGKVGSPCSQKDLEKIYKIGVKRYEHQIPPGFKDQKKDGLREYGDLVIWFQIIEQAKSRKKPIIFITDENKEDWWHKFRGKIIGPRPELINEIFSKADVDFYMYQTDQFMKYASKYLHEPVNLETIEEVQKVRKFDERSLRFLNILKKQREYLKTHPKNKELEKKIIEIEIELDDAIGYLLHLKDIEADEREIDEQKDKIDNLSNNLVKIQSYIAMSDKP